MMSKTTTAARVLTLAAILAAGTFTLIGCTEKKGPAEKAGEKVDETVDKMKDAVDPKGPAEKAGEKIDKALDD
jgi:uncharacterized protein YgiB involved in biofilm formation